MASFALPVAFEPFTSVAGLAADADLVRGSIIDPYRANIGEWVNDPARESACGGGPRQDLSPQVRRCAEAGESQLSTRI